jgi:membrane protein
MLLELPKDGQIGLVPSHSVFSWHYFLALFILTYSLYSDSFQQDFLFVSEGVPPNTYYAIEYCDDILNSNSGLLSSGFLLSILLMANGLNAILGGFENCGIFW